MPSLQEHISVTQRELLEEFPADAFANLSNTHTNFLWQHSSKDCSDQIEIFLNQNLNMFLIILINFTGIGNLIWAPVCYHKFHCFVCIFVWKCIGSILIIDLLLPHCHQLWHNCNVFSQMLMIGYLSTFVNQCQAVSYFRSSHPVQLHFCALHSTCKVQCRTLCTRQCFVTTLAVITI